MLWIGVTFTLIVGVAVVWFVIPRRPVRVETLGSVSVRWIAEHRADL